ncbi:hypothetical protein EG829_29170, partial [bacterium]|nr:hypothetical protein [bacterium]
MGVTFVAISDPVHDLLRTMNRQAPLHCWLEHNGHVSIRHRVQAADWPDAYFKVALLHSLGGMPLETLQNRQLPQGTKNRLDIAMRAGFLDLTKLDRRCCRDLRRTLDGTSPVMTSGELLCYGLGTLRAQNNDLADPATAHLMRYYGRIFSGMEDVLDTILALHPRSDRPEDLGKEAYDSTNLLYGDVYGEVEQLWERRAETAFLERGGTSLQSFAKRSQAHCWRPPPATKATISL